MVEGGGFEPPKAEPADLQSAPFGRSGTPPKTKVRILYTPHEHVNSDTDNSPNLIKGLVLKASKTSRLSTDTYFKRLITAYFFAARRSLTSLITTSETLRGQGI